MNASTGIPRTPRRRASPQEGVLQGPLAFLAYGSGPPLVFLRGLSPSTANPHGLARWSEARFLAPLAQHFTVYAVNNPPDLHPGTTMADIAAAHARALDAAFATPVHVLGISTGGAIALQLAVDHPQVLQTLVLAATAHQLGPIGRAVQRRYADGLAQGQQRRALQALAPAMTESHLGQRLVGSLLWLAASLAWAENPEAMAITLYAEDGLDVGDRLPTIAMPTLVIGGDHDRLYPPELVKETAARIPNAEYRLYRGRDHGGVLRDRRLMRDILAFLVAQQAR